MKLNTVDPEDIDEVIAKIQRSYHFRFQKMELEEVKTFGELCDIILCKLKYKDVPDCTSQQAFYKLRAAICLSQGIESGLINPKTKLATLFPVKNRRQNLRLLEQELGFSPDILRPKHWVSTVLIIVLVFSFISLFFSLWIGLAGIAFCIAGFKLASYFGREMDIETIGDLVIKMTRDYYLKCRRSSQTINKTEVIENIRALFADHCALDLSIFTRDATFY